MRIVIDIYIYIVIYITLEHEIMKFISVEQEAVVLYRIKQGYQVEFLSNGFYKLWKNRHTMIINGLGYDTYTGIQ